MDIHTIQIEVSKVSEAGFAHKTDKQLWSYQELSERYYSKNNREQPKALVKYNLPASRMCKLTKQQVKEIRKKYIPHIYGKKRLALEYGVSASVILRILKGKSWKVYDDSG